MITILLRSLVLGGMVGFGYAYALTSVRYGYTQSALIRYMLLAAASFGALYGAGCQVIPFTLALWMVSWARLAYYLKRCQS